MRNQRLGLLILLGGFGVWVAGVYGLVALVKATAL
jgi:hypothetical protein